MMHVTKQPDGSVTIATDSGEMNVSQLDFAALIKAVSTNPSDTEDQVPHDSPSASEDDSPQA